MIVVGDIGGTHVRLAQYEKDGTLADLVVEETPQEYNDGLARLSAYKNTLTKPIEAVSIGIAARVSLDNGTLTGSAHLEGWSGTNFKQDMESLFGVPAYIQNDVVMGALGEAVEGAGHGANTVAYIAVGTGIGARCVRNEIVDPASDIRFGHRHLTIDGKTQEFEDFISGTAIMRDHHSRTSRLHDDTLWETYSRYFAYGMHEALTEWSPDRVVLGGFIPNDERISIARVEKYMHELFPTDVVPPIAYAKLPYSGLTGAGIYATRALAKI